MNALFESRGDMTGSTFVTFYFIIFTPDFNKKKIGLKLI